MNSWMHQRLVPDNADVCALLYLCSVLFLTEWSCWSDTNCIGMALRVWLSSSPAPCKGRSLRFTLGFAQ